MTVRVLDLFCGGGGATEGYMRAGWEVTGVDRRKQTGYPGKEFHRGDAIEFLKAHGHEYDVIHASPPCQGYSQHTYTRADRAVTERQKRRLRETNLGKDEPQLILATRAWLKKLKKPYVIENVVGARWEMLKPITLCGGMFGLHIRRHRLFEVRPEIPDPIKGHTCVNVRAEARKLGWDFKELSIVGDGERAGVRDRWIWLLDNQLNKGMSRYQTKESIPPVYTHFIAECLKEMGVV